MEDAIFYPLLIEMKMERLALILDLWNLRSGNFMHIVIV